MPGREPTAKEYREAAREMTATGHPFLARELHAEADRLDTQTADTDKEN